MAKKDPAPTPKEPAEPTPAPVPEEPVESAAPAYITAEQFQAQMAAEREANRQMFQEVLAGTRPEAPRPVAAAIDDPSEDELIAAYESGDARQIAKVTQRKVAAAETRAARAFAVENAALREQLNTGMSAVGDIATRVGAQGLAHYARFKKEIDAAVANMPAQDRMKPDALTVAHNYVVGMHASELIAEAEERGRRADAAVIDSPKGPRTPRGSEETDVPTPAQALGETTARYLADSGDPTGDKWAVQRGYRDWEDFITAKPGDTARSRRKKERAERHANLH